MAPPEPRAGKRTGTTDSPPPEAAIDGAEVAFRRAIAVRLLAVRQQNGLSLREAADRSGLSRSFIAMVEKGTSEIAVSRLIRLADAYGLQISDLLDSSQASRSEFVPSRSTRIFPSGSDRVIIRYLSSSSWDLQPFTVDLKPGAKLEDLRHPGDEFIHCLIGTPTIVVENKMYVMNPGDSVVLASRAVHGYMNRSAVPAKLLGAVRHVSESLRSELTWQG